MATPGTAAPVPSRTIPVRLLLFTCADIRPVKARHMTTLAWRIHTPFSYRWSISRSNPSLQAPDKAVLLLPERRLAESALHHIVRIGRNRAVAPEPAHHLRHDRAPELLAVQVHPPGIVDIITLLRESLHQTDIL